MCGVWCVVCVCVCECVGVVCVCVCVVCVVCVCVCVWCVVIVTNLMNPYGRDGSSTKTIALLLKVNK